MRKGLTHLSLIFLDVFKSLIFSVERRIFWPAERRGGIDGFLLACLAYWPLEEYRLREVSR